LARVTVVIAAYDSEATIGQTLSSVFAQTYDDWEAVVVDDGSSDHTAEVAASFGPRVRVVKTGGNAGAAAARNIAARHGNGELIALVDADDWWLPDYLESQTAALAASGEGTAVVACDALLAGADGELLNGTYSDTIPFPDELLLEDLLRYNPVFSSALVRREAWDEVGGPCAELPRAADWDLWIRFVESGHRIVQNRRPLAVYRLRPGSLSSDPGALAEAARRVYERALERGNLTPRQRRVARRGARLQRAAFRYDAYFHSRSNGDRGSLIAAVGSLPFLAFVAAEHPRRWRAYAGLVQDRGRHSPFPR
jgi:glycosyltransferase involved in cell wall biosynthesis